MKKLISLALILMLILPSLTACADEPSADEILRDFISAYGASGVIYSSECVEGDDGYLPSGKLEKIYVFSGRFPENYAIFLNLRAGYGSECGAFVCDDTDMRLSVEEMCLERIRLLSGGENAFIKRSGNIVVYSTMSDGARAEQIFDKIIKGH